VALAAFLSGIAIYVNIFAALAVVAAVAFMVLLAAPFAALPRTRDAQLPRLTSLGADRRPCSGPCVPPVRQ